jgi:hypothetical protein
VALEMGVDLLVNLSTSYPTRSIEYLLQAFELIIPSQNHKNRLEIVKILSSVSRISTSTTCSISSSFSKEHSSSSSKESFKGHSISFSKINQSITEINNESRLIHIEILQPYLYLKTSYFENNFNNNSTMKNSYSYEDIIKNENKSEKNENQNEIKCKSRSIKGEAVRRSGSLILEGERVFEGNTYICVSIYMYKYIIYLYLYIDELI